MFDVSKFIEELKDREKLIDEASTIVKRIVEKNSQLNHSIKELNQANRETPEPIVDSVLNLVRR